MVESFNKLFALFWDVTNAVEMIIDYRNILPILQTMAMVICLGGATLLFLRRRNNRSRSILAMIMLLWGIFYAVRVVGALLNNPSLNFTSANVMEPFVFVWGNLYLIILLLYPIEIMRPGWLNLKRTGLLLLPYVAVSLLYYVILFLLDQEPESLGSLGQFLEHIGNFNVWYRLFMNISVIGYLVFLYWLIWRYKPLYQQWCSNNYSNSENMDVSWLRQYAIGVVLIGVAYFGLLLNGGTICFIVHNIIVQCFFAYTLYKGLFHDNPYTENFFRQTLNEEAACLEAELNEEQIFSKKILPEGNESAFLKNLSLYRNQVSDWMVEKKPYLDPDFKLMDVSEVLPLNRTYISRVFNEGFGESFSDVVREYRIREAERMLLSRKDIPVGQVGELCGFSSASVFHRAFVQSHEGLTPNRYRKQAGD